MHFYQIYQHTFHVETDLNPASTRLLADDLEAQFVLNLVACARQVSSRALLSKARGDGNICLARQTAMYLINVILGRSLTYTGDLFGRDRRTVAHACARIEEMRERMPFDRVINCFEKTVLLAMIDLNDFAEQDQ